MSKVRCIVAMLLLAVAGTSFAATVYVDASATGSNNGTSWQSAFTDLQSAMPGTGNTVLVAEGIYKPSSTDRTVSFAPGAGCTLMGGYSTRGARLGENPTVVRDPSAWFTILSGDVNGDDGLFKDLYFEDPSDLWEDGMGTFARRADRLDNSEHVMVIAAAGVTLDGVVVERGQTSSDGGGAHGANVLVQADTTINNCIFRYGVAGHGGAVAFDAGTSTLTNSWITQNTNTFGGNVYMSGGSTTTVRNCVFTRNSGDGGWTSEQGDSAGIYIGDSGGMHVFVYDTVFDRNITDQNHSSGRQGVLSVRPAGSSSDCFLEAYNCVMTNNIIACGFSGTPGGGGCVTIHGSENTTAHGLLKNCLIANNAMRNQRGIGSPEASSGNGGIGIRVSVLAIADIENCTVVNNTGNMSLHASLKGCGIGLDFHPSFPTALPVANIKNSIVWGNQYNDVQIRKDSNGVEMGTATISYSCIDSSDDDPNGHHTGTGVINTNPQFVDGLYNVAATSPTIDAGNPASDWSKEPKCNGERVNMGYTGASGKATPKVSVANVLDGDVNCDDIVNLADFSKMASEWLQ
jgi:hypothetical protein